MQNEPELYSKKLYQYFDDLHTSYENDLPIIAERGFTLLSLSIFTSFSIISGILIWIHFKSILNDVIYTIVCLALTLLIVITARELVRLKNLLRESQTLARIMTESKNDQDYIGRLETLQATVNAKYQIDHKIISNIPRHSILNLTVSSSGHVLEFYLTFISKEYKSLILSNISDDEKAFTRIEDENFRKTYEMLTELQIVDLINAELKLGHIAYQDIESLKQIESEVNEET